MSPATSADPKLSGLGAKYLFWSELARNRSIFECKKATRNTLPYLTEFSIDAFPTMIAKNCSSLATSSD